MTKSLASTNGRERNRTIVRALTAVGCGAVMFAAVFAAQAAPVGSGNKEEGFQSSVPAAILLDADSDSILYEKNGDQPVEPANLAKLMTLEFLFNEIKQDRVKPDDEYIISENAWRATVSQRSSQLSCSISLSRGWTEAERCHHVRFAARSQHGEVTGPVKAPRPQPSNVRFWHKADISRLSSNVRFRENSGRCSCGSADVEEFWPPTPSSLALQIRAAARLRDGARLGLRGR